MPEDPPAAALTSFDQLLLGIAAPTHRARYNIFDISLELARCGEKISTITNTAIIAFCISVIITPRLYV